MKKSLIALAALATVATGAQAQSSVTIYGIIDGGYNSLEDSHSFGTNASTLPQKTKVTNTGSNGESATSRIGVKGTEDLGGGLTANFVTEWALSPNANTQLNEKTTGAANRQSWVGIADKKLGEVRLGRQYSTVHGVVTGFNAGGANNTSGSLAYRADTGEGGGYTVRASNVVTYSSPTFSGFSAVVGMGETTNENSSYTGANIGKAEGKAKLTLAGLNYATGPFRAAYARAVAKLQGRTLVAGNVVDSTSTNNFYGNNVAATVSGAVVTEAGTAIDFKQTEEALGAAYNFGVAELLYTRQQTKMKDNTDSDTTKRTVDEIGVKVPVTARIDVWALYADGTVGSTGKLDVDQKGYQLGAKYNFSKRTSIYTIYGKQETESNSTQSVIGKVGKAERKELSAGIRHDF